MINDLRAGDTIDDRYEVVGELDLPPNAGGGFARVFEVHDSQTDQHFAFKVLRPEHTLVIDDARRRDWYQAFVREADLLTELRDDPRVIDMFDTGYLCALENRKPRTHHVQRPSAGDIQTDRELMADAIEERWRPFLVLRLCEKQHSLHDRVMRYGGSPLPMVEAMQFTLDLVDFLVELHERRIIYWDAKPAHGYWDGHRMWLIDWNGSFRVTDPDLTRLTRRPADEAMKVDVAIVAREFIYPAFVAKNWKDGSTPLSRGTQSAQDLSKDSAERWQGKVEFYEQQFILDEPVRDFLTQAVQSEFQTAGALQEAARACAHTLGWEWDGRLASPRRRKALKHKRMALTHLREALDLFREAEQELEVAVGALNSPDAEHLAEETARIREMFERLGF